MNIIYKIMLKLALKFHNLSYKLSTKFAIKAEGGLHPKHRLMSYHKFFVRNINSSDKVLDVGCGNGALTFDLAKKAVFVVGIDLDRNNIELAKKNYHAENIEYRVGDATKDLGAQKFDIIVLSNVLEHIRDKKSFLLSLKTLAPNILIRVPMLNRDWITLYKKELGIEWRSDSTHFIEYTKDIFDEELRSAGLKIDNYSIQFGEIWAQVS